MLDTKERQSRDGHGHGTKTLSSLKLLIILIYEEKSKKDV